MSVQSIDRVLDIVELLSRAQQPVSVTEIGRGLGLHKSTAFRLVSALRDRGYVEKDERSNGYRIGPRFIEVSSRYLNQIELTTEAAPFLADLSRQVRQTTSLATLQEGRVVYLDRVEQLSSIRRYSIIGQRRLLHCTALGKALLLALSEEEVRSIVGPDPLEARTPGSITSVDRLVHELRESAVRGWTTDDEEDEVGTRCVGAPIRDYRGTIVAAVSASWFTTPPAQDFAAVAPYVVAAAGEISRRLGYAAAASG